MQFNKLNNDKGFCVYYRRVSTMATVYMIQQTDM